MRALKVSGIIVGALVLLALALVGILYLTRGTPVSTVRTFGDGAAPAVNDPLFRRTLELLAGMNLEQGNAIDVLVNGDETYPPLWEDLRSAKKSITVQFYYSMPGKVATELKDILIERARAGVEVLFLRDAFGSQRLTDEYQDSLVNAGVRVALFRPPRWYQLDKAAHRSHIRVVVVDGHVGYTGGFGLDDKFLGNGRVEGSWRDTNVRFLGPAVMQLQATFAAGWAEATGELLTGEVFFPLEEFQPEGDFYAALLYTAPTTGSTPAERFLALSLAGARRTMYISNSYFVPDDDFRRMLVDAARRGVDVRILTAGDKTDIKTTWYAGRKRYEELLQGGVRIYEYQPTMMHAKTFVIDGVWSTIGTMNFDNRSLAFNDETNLVAYDRRIGAAMDSIFIEDLKYSREIKLEEFRQRPWHQKLLENGAHLISRVL
ncbi:MAG: phospholipase D-like domain-containing protein [Gemmatimonadota bacterium]|nr:phospholipase D-like domain-containing protein [Gemmatimonadota bacterium]